VLLMVIAFALFVGGGVLATLPYEVPAVDDPAQQLECGPPFFELVVPSDDQPGPTDEACGAAAGSRFWWGLVTMLAGVGLGFGARRLHRRQVVAARRRARRAADDESAVTARQG
jgi:hypothetical protein